jgi:hypothetical protein
MLKPQDIIIALKLCSLKDESWKYGTLASDLHMSPSEVHSGMKRLKKCNLVTELSIGTESAIIPDKENILEFLIHGIRYVFPLERGEPAKGLPTSFGVDHLFNGIKTGSLIPVWGFETADYFGVTVKPLYKTLPLACINDFGLYELMALCDALRDDSKDVRKIAEDKIRTMI